MQQMNRKPIIPVHMNTNKCKSVMAGLASGVAVASCFSPYDRALYLSVKHMRPFLSKMNWCNPYQGVSQTMLHRTLSNGLYFPLHDIFKDAFGRKFEKNSGLTAWSAGMCAGLVNGLVLNPLIVVKYQTWNSNSKFLQTTKDMWKKDGIRPFMKGIIPTVYRDIVFGGIFAALNHAFRNHEPDSQTWKFIHTMTAAFVATSVSSPFNYVRFLKFATPVGEKPPTIIQGISSLISSSMKKKNPFLYCMQRLRIGYSTIRVSLGITFGYYLYESCKTILKIQN